MHKRQIWWHTTFNSFLYLMLVCTALASVRFVQSATRLSHTMAMCCTVSMIGPPMASCQCAPSFMVRCRGSDSCYRSTITKSYTIDTVQRGAEKRILFDVMGFFNSEAQNRTKAQGTWPPSRHNTLNKLHSAGGRDNHKQKKKKNSVYTLNKETTHLGYVEASKTAYTEQRKLSVRTYTSGSGCLHSFVQWNAEEIAGLGKKINALRRSQELLPWLCSGKGNILAECLNKVVAMEKKTCFALLCALECN